jgi:hypothetical protein
MTPGDMWTPTSTSLAAPTLEAWRIRRDDADLLLVVVACSGSIPFVRTSATFILVAEEEDVRATMTGLVLSMEITRSRRRSAGEDKEEC